ncbi:MAG: NAD/NADP octopine/nopaline dehydrogenase family protein [Candidatus Cloacimonetes bacterium]|nr:NAD/NADP octopine/nopaline dehydrogenase family protein [Candidatus Cloacimonadota bacterium]
MKICIIGAGNAGCTHAFKFTEHGHEVRLVKTSHSMHDDYFEIIRRNHSITAIDDTRGGLESSQKIHMITRNMQEGINGSDVVFVMTQSLQHDYLSPIVAPYLSDGQMLLIIPGNCGSLIFARHITAKVLIGEGESTPFDARIETDNKVHILFKNVRNALSFLPASDTDRGLKMSGLILDTYGYSRKNVIESGLHNPNMVVHTIGSIMSAARIEQMKGEFWMYRESFSPAIWNMVHRLDNEKNGVIECFGGNSLSYLDACKFRNEKDLTKDSLSVFRAYAEKGGPKGPGSLNTRFIYEDVPNGLCLLSSLGKKCGIETPVCNALITLANALMNVDYWKLSRSIEKLGLVDMSITEIKNFIGMV